MLFCSVGSLVRMLKRLGLVVFFMLIVLMCVVGVGWVKFLVLICEFVMIIGFSMVLVFCGFFLLVGVGVLVVWVWVGRLRVV